MSSLVSGDITGEGGALSMLEMAEGTIWGSRAVLKIANCVCARSNVHESSTVCKRTTTEQPIWSKKG